jgi:hypothetical protein
MARPPWDCARRASTLIFQRWAPDHARARAFAALQAVNYAAIDGSMTVSGLLLTVLTPAWVCVVAGGVGVCALLIAFRVPPRKQEPVRGTFAADANECPRSTLKWGLVGMFRGCLGRTACERLRPSWSG